MRIVIICARTWGQMGNFLAAQRLAETLKLFAEPGTSIHVQPAEELCPGVAQTGQRMLEIASCSGNLAERRARYLALIEELQTEYPQGFEVGNEIVGDSSDVKLLAEFLESEKPDLIIGTKGFFSRMAQAATGYGGLLIPIINYVTNDGLLTLPLHQTSGGILNLVQTEFGARMIADRSPFKIVGPLVGHCTSSQRLIDPDKRLQVGVLCNRNPEYKAIYDALAEYGDAIRVKTIVIGCPELLSDLRLHAPAHWDILDAQLAKNYLELLADLRTATDCVFVTKSSPNAVLEAVAAGLPVLALNSGLPMEEWMLQLIKERGLGWPAHDSEHAVSILRSLVGQPKHIAEMSASVFKYSTTSINNHSDGSNIYQAILSVLNHQSSIFEACLQ